MRGLLRFIPLDFSVSFKAYSTSRRILILEKTIRLIMILVLNCDTLETERLLVALNSIRTPIAP